MRSEPRRSYRVGPSVLVVAGAAAGALFVLSRLQVSDPWAHAAGHTVAAAAAAAFLLLALRFWPRPIPHPVGRTAWLIAVAGLVLFTVGQLAEGIGAFGFDGYRAISALARVHDLAMFAGVAGLLLTLLGALMSIVVVGASRLRLLGSRWFVVVLWTAAGAVALFVVGALIFGY